MIKNQIKTNKLSREQREKLLLTLQTRFEQNTTRHESISWGEVASRLEVTPEKLLSLHEMDRTGGEPDVVARDEETDEMLFFDCSPESPDGRRSLCYDREGLESRKDHKPKGSAMDMAAAMGIEMLTEAQYIKLQKLGLFDTKTSSWLKTPPDVRSLGGAIFGDRRYDRVFVYHNGAQSYYGARGFRGVLRV